MGRPKFGTREERDAIAVEMKALHKQGVSYSKIADKFGVNPATVGYYLKLRDKGKKRGPYKKHKTILKHSSNGVVSVLGGPTDSGTEATGFAAGFISGWLGSYAAKHGLEATALTVDVVNILRKEVR